MAPKQRHSRPAVSVILPCYRAVDLAQRSVLELSDQLDQTARDGWEIIVVDDGGGDFPEDAWAADQSVRLIRLPRNAGKGAAVKAGMMKARGSARVFTDVDLPYGPELIPVMAGYLIDGPFHLVIGDRNLPGSRYREDLGLLRRGISALSTLFIGTLVTGGVFDTQCGLKGIRGDLAELLFPLITIDRFAFDVELIYLALHHNFDIKRVPVRLRRHQTRSSVRPLRDTLRAGWDVLGIERRKIRGDYDCPKLRALLHAESQARVSTADGQTPPGRQACTEPATHD